MNLFERLTYGLLTVALLWLSCRGATAQQQYNYFIPGGSLSCTSPCKQQSTDLASGSFILNRLPAGNLPQVNSTSFVANATTSTANQASLTALGAANMMAAVIAANVVATSNITLSGIQTIDGVVGLAGTTVLVTQQTNGADNGIYVMASGAWTRAVNFPSGYVIPQFCDLSVMIERGAANQGFIYQMTTTGGTTTIGTTAQGWSQRAIAFATNTTPGIVIASGSANTSQKAALIQIAPGAGGVGDCVDYATAGGNITNDGNLNGDVGPCIEADANGHPFLTGNGTGPTVTGTGCSKVTGSQDNTGSITATGVDTCTLTFGGAFTNTPFCTVANIGATVLATLSAQPTTAHAIFVTAAAGTFNYHCF